MAYSAGQYANSVTNQKESIDKMLYTLSANNAPLIAKYMRLNPAGTKADPIVKQTKHYFIQKRMKTLRDTLQAAITTTSATTIYTNDQYADYKAASGDLVGTLIRVDSEVMLVTAASYSSPKWTLTVTRGYASTTAATHSKDAKVIILNFAVKEGADASRSDSEYSGNDYNYTQIFDTVIHHTGTQQAIEGHTKENQINKQMADKMPTLWKRMQHCMIHGVRYQTGSNNETRTMGGMKQFVAADMVEDCGNNPITVAKLEDYALKLETKGVDTQKPLMLLAGKNLLRGIANFKGAILQETVKTKTMDYVVNKVVLPCGIKLELEPYIQDMLDDEAFIYPKNSMKWKHLRKWDKAKLGKNGDSDRVLGLSEATCEFPGWSLGGALEITNVA